MPLDSEQAIEKFLDTSIHVKESTGFFKKIKPDLGVHYNKLKFKSRVLVFMSDKEDYETEFKIIKETSRLLSQRLSVRVGLVTDIKLIKQYKAKWGSLWFNDDVQLNTVVLQRFDKEYFSFDLFNLREVGTLIHFINKRSLEPVTKIDGESNLMIEMVG